MAEFKKLSAVETVESVSDTANVLIEENGVIKKAPKDEIGGGIKVASTAEVGQTIVVKAVDAAGIPTEWECADMSGGEEPDMVMLLTGYLSGSSSFADGIAELSIIAGTPSAIKAKLEAGESPVVKMKHVRGAYGDYSHSRCEYDVYVVTYSEDYWFSTIAIGSDGSSLYKVSGGFNADGNITWRSAASIT